VQEHGSNSVAQDLAQGNVKLVQRHEVATDLALDGFGDVNGDGTALQSDTKTEDNTRSDDHA
jgi:hypothetical protein